MYEIFEKLLREKGITAYKVAKEAGVTQTALSNWKTGSCFSIVDLITLNPPFYSFKKYSIGTPK